ncbi:hypothetical protein C723_2885 [Christiangramia flava JLT2011]|nr:hypothetical protein C723_2885 [Christiangramia flava JLT2011]
MHGLWQFPNYGVYKAIEKLRAKGESIPKVASMPHGMLDPYFQKAEDRRIKAIRNEVVWRFTEKKAINNADAIFFTCEEELKLARTTFKGYEPKREINVGYGIQKPPKFREEFSIAFGKRLPNLQNNYWLFLSRIHPKKGVDLLIKAYKESVQENSSIPDLVIAGPLNSSYAKEIQKIAGGHSKIHFPGMLVGEEKWGALYNCETFILPSHQENFGIAVVEAMACGKPVLISKNVNIWREISEIKGGWFFKDLTAASIYNSLKEFTLKPKEQIEAAGANAQTGFQRLFNAEKQSEVLLRELQEL